MYFKDSTQGSISQESVKIQDHSRQCFPRDRHMAHFAKINFQFQMYMYIKHPENNIKSP